MEVGRQWYWSSDEIGVMAEGCSNRLWLLVLWCVMFDVLFCCSTKGGKGLLACADNNLRTEKNMFLPLGRKINVRMVCNQMAPKVNQILQIRLTLGWFVTKWLLKLSRTRERGGKISTRKELVLTLKFHPCALLHHNFSKQQSWSWSSRFFFHLTIRLCQIETW